MRSQGDNTRKRPATLIRKRPAIARASLLNHYNSDVSCDGFSSVLDTPDVHAQLCLHLGPSSFARMRACSLQKWRSAEAVLCNLGQDKGRNHGLKQIQTKYVMLDVLQFPRNLAHDVLGLWTAGEGQFLCWRMTTSSSWGSDVRVDDVFLGNLFELELQCIHGLRYQGYWRDKYRAVLNGIPCICYYKIPDAGVPDGVKIRLGVFACETPWGLLGVEFWCPPYNPRVHGWLGGPADIARLIRVHPHSRDANATAAAANDAGRNRILCGIHELIPPRGPEFASCSLSESRTRFAADVSVNR